MSTSYKLRWSSDKPHQAYQLALLGATDKQIAEVLGCNIQTLDYWKRTNKMGFRDQLNCGKMEADAKVAEALYKAATGYDVKEEKVIVVRGIAKVVAVIRYVSANPWAAHKWLASRQREMGWADVQRIESIQTNININKFDFSGLSTDELMLVKKLGLKQLAEHVEQN